MPDAEYYHHWMTSLESKLSVPTLPASFLQVFHQLGQAQLAKQQAERQKGILNIKARQNPKITAQDLEEAQAVVDEKELIVQRALREAVQQQYPLLSIDTAIPDSLRNDWMTFILLKTHTPEKWANAPAQEQCLDFLQHDHELQYQILLAGGAAQHETSRALELYRMLLQEIDQDKSPYAALWDKLALAVALELCVPLPLFGKKHQFVDPVERCRHYELAFLQGELDPYFEHFSVFELRHVINSDADSAALAWGREALMNFRPQLLYEAPPQWRYSQMVKTDVPYKAPDWYKGYQSYDQILEGGGKCGPRAWYGRFICKAFGIPTWGAKQQGHAAMARWTEHGWETNLGGGFRVNFWEGRCGLHFQLETQVRNLLGEDAYFRQILPMIWYAIYSHKSQGDSNPIVQMQFQPTGQNVWLSLALMKSQMLVQNALTAGTPMGVSYPRSCSIPHNKVQLITDAPNVDESSVHIDPDSGTLVVPASAPLQRPANKVWCPKSCLGGKQLLINGPVSLEYQIPDRKEQYYKVSLRVCVIKRNVDPLRIGWKGSATEQEVSIPNTHGGWQWTEPCALERPHSSILVLKRLTQQHLIAVKDIRLEPVSAEEYQVLIPRK